MFSTQSSSTLVPDEEIDRWVRSMFGPGQFPEQDGVKLVVKVDGRALSGQAATMSFEDAHAALRELKSSLAMYGGASVLGDVAVAPPSASMIHRALRVLNDPTARRQALGAALSIFGRRVIAPFERALEVSEESPTMRLRHWRDALRSGLVELGLTHETRQILEKDLDGLLSDEYLAMLGDNEDKTLRPRLGALAQRVLDALAHTFHRALDRFGSNAEQIAQRVFRTLPPSMPLRDAASHLKVAFVDATAEFLAVETSAELAGTLRTLSTQYADVVPAQRPLTFNEDWYREIAAECWTVIAQAS